MDRNERRFAREARNEIRELIAHCEAMPVSETPAPGTPGSRAVGDPAPEEFEGEAEIIVRSSVGGSASLAFFIPYLWKHRR